MSSENRKKRQRGDTNRVVDFASVVRNSDFPGPQDIAVTLFKVVDQGPPLKAQYEVVHVTTQAAQDLLDQLTRVLGGADRGWEQ